MRPKIFSDVIAKKVWCMLLMLPLSALWAGEDKGFQEVTGTTDVAINKTVPSVKISLLTTEVAGSTFVAYNASRLVTEPQGLVKLYYPFSTTRPTGEATVTVTVSYLALINDKLEPKTTTATLSIKLEAASVKNIDFVKLPQAVKIISTTITAASVPATFTGIKLYHEVVAQVYDVLNLQTPSQINPAFSLSHSDVLLAKNGTLDVTWSSIKGATSYELEWTYVSDVDTNYDIVNNVKVFRSLAYSKISVRDYLFRHNSSRVNTVQTTYSIPLVYEKGLILYRLRALGKNQVGGKLIEVKSLWSAPENFTNLSSFPSANIYPFKGLDIDMNWQASVSYAEEGKNKAVVSYHDGTSRNRQAVTKINTDERAIVGETMYDYNGRPQIQTLPVPTKGNVLNYHHRFNKIEGKDIVEKAQYDTAEEGKGCDVLAPKFQTDSGASNYYSPQNHFDDDPINKGRKLLNKNLIPDAKKYPYTQTYYTNDNTGRIAAQSGVGDNHLIGSTHETKYLYGAPDQPEISRLFGTDVGNAAHYKKNVVIDPNKQASVSYLDMDGKVIATALTGKIPDNVTELEGNKVRLIESNMLDAVSYPLSNDYNYKEYISTFSVAEDAKYTFLYSGSVGGYSFSCTDQKTHAVKTVNLSGVVDVEFKLIDKCKKTLINAFTTTNYSTTSSASQNINMPIMADGGTVAGEVNLVQGQYDVIKRVSINQQKLEQYWQHYMTNPSYNCILTEDSLVKAAKNSIDISGCEVSCAACTTKVQALMTSGVSLTDEEKYSLEHLCDNLCSDNAKCGSGLNTMIADMSKDGQYGKIRRDKLVQASVNGPDKKDFEQNGVDFNDFELSLQTSEGGGDANNPDDENIDPSLFPMSIFNNNNSLRSPALTLSGSTACFSELKASWKHPVRIYFDDLTTSAGKTPSTKVYTNTVLFDGSKDFATAKYEETEYRDPTGAIVYATVSKNPDNSYTPSVDPGSPVTLVSAALNTYQVPVRYLSSVKDFLPYWQGNFANYLVVYHPEYRYFVECTSNKVSNAYERKLLSIGEKDLAKAQGLLDANNIPTILTQDPLYTNDPKAKQFLQYIYNNYQNSKPMHQIVTKSIDCPTGSDQCGTIPEATCYNGVINTDQKWVMLVGLYLAERQKYEHGKITQTAISKGFFNGCVGDQYFYGKEDARNFYYYPYNNAPTVDINVCRFQYWWRWSEAYSTPSAGCCKPINRSSYWYFNHPFFDFAQTCNVWDYHNYSDKVRRFEPTHDMVNNGLSINESNCTVTIPALGSEPAYTMETPCQSQVLDFITRGTKKAEAIKYEKCGLCPIATDLEQFLLGVKKKTFFKNGVETLISCMTSANYVALGGTLQKQFHTTTNTDYPKLYWTGTLSADKKTLTGTLRNSYTSVIQTVTLTIPASEGKTFDDNFNFCCISTDAATPNSFKLEATYFKTVENEKVEFNITGTITGASLTSCSNSIPPTCTITTKAGEVMNLLNVLLLTGGTKGKQLQSSVVALDNATWRDVYEPSVRNLIDKEGLNASGAYANAFNTFTPTWEATKNASNELVGKLKLTGTSITQIDVEIVPLSSGSISNYNNIERFTNAREFSDPSCTGAPKRNCEVSSFVADAVVMVAGVKTFVPVTIQVPQLVMSICRPVVFIKQ